MKADTPDTTALREKVIGTWRMLSWKRKLVDSGVESDALGPNPFGYISYAPDGRLMVFVLKSGRPLPASTPPTPETVDPMDGKRCTYKVEFERALSPR